MGCRPRWAACPWCMRPLQKAFGMVSSALWSADSERGRVSTACLPARSAGSKGLLASWCCSRHGFTCLQGAGQTRHMAHTTSASHGSSLGKLHDNLLLYDNHTTFVCMRNLLLTGGTAARSLSTCCCLQDHKHKSYWRAKSCAPRRQE